MSLLALNESLALSDISCLIPSQTLTLISLVSLKMTLVVKLFTKSQETSTVDFILVMTVCRLSPNKMSVHSILGAKMCSNAPPHRRICLYALRARNTY